MNNKFFGRDWPSKYIEIPYKDNGRDDNGCDCWGLPRLIYIRERNIVLESYAGEYNGAYDPSIPRLKDCHRHEWERVENPGEFDLVSLRLAGRPWHVGVMIDKENMIHTQVKIGVSIESIRHPMWFHRVEGFYRWKPVS